MTTSPAGRRELGGERERGLELARRRTPARGPSGRRRPRRRSWQNALLVSIRAAAARLGPNTGIPAALSASATPAASGASGPITTSSTALAAAARDDRRRVERIDRRQASDPRLGADRGAARARR